MSRSLILVGQIATFTAVSVVPLWGLAQEQRPPVRVANQPDADGANQQRPPAIQPQIQTPKEMEPFLQTWEQQSSKIDRIEGTFKKYEYDFVFKTEKRADGRYWFEKPDKGRMDFSPEKNVPEAPNNVHKVGNTEFTIEADAARSWICTGEVILDVDIPNKTYNEIQIPKHFQGEQISEGPLPFLFGMKAARMKQRYLMTFHENHDPSRMIHIVAFPLRAQEQREFQRAEVLLDPRTYMPSAVKLWDPSGNKETVYVFTKHDPRSLPWLPKAPWNMNLTLLGFKKLREYQAPDPNEQTTGATGLDANIAPQRTATGGSGILAR